MYLIMVQSKKSKMFKNVYNRCKNYLNSYTTIGKVLILLFFLILPTFTYKPSNGFFYNMIFAYQYNLTNILSILYYIYNIWNYLHKNVNIRYQAHRYGSSKKIINNNICDVIFIGIVWDIVFLILNISVAIFLNDGYYISFYKYYEITNILYLLYIIIIRFIFIGIISTIVYYIYYTNNQTVKLFLFSVIVFNFFKIDNILPITISSILAGYQYKTFWSEIMSTLTMILCYIIALIIIKKITINKKRDIG